MIPDIIDISQGWELGWTKELKLNKWMQIFGFWKIGQGRLQGQGHNAEIVANIEPEDNYSWQSVVCVDDAEATVNVVIKYYVERFAYYSIVIKPGSNLNVNYVLSAGLDEVLLENVGPVIEVGNEYKVRVDVQDNLVKIYINEECIGQFESKHLTGKHPGFRVTGGRARFRDVKLVDLNNGDVVFRDDFEKNSLARKVPVEISELDCKEWIPADIPGTVHSSLLKAGKIEDPYIGYNGPRQKWIDKQRWVYKKKFTVPDNWKGENISIFFEGFDYHGYVWLNGTLLGYHEGMFGGPEFDISSLLKYEGQNEFIVCLLPCPYPAHSNVKPYILQRWHFNMDILTVGLWRSVKLIATNKIILHSPQVITRNIEDGKAQIEVSASVVNYAMYPFQIKVKFMLQSPCSDDPDVAIEFDTGFFQGTLRVTKTIEVESPKLWWPNGMGDQPLYKLTAQVKLYEPQKSKEPTSSYELSTDFGIRTLEMKKSPNTGGNYKWVLSINGRDFFGKGSNWMPIVQMLRLDPEKYDKLLKLARDSNINLLRPWGAGLYETDEFYQACDRYGICVWQEMLLANGYFKEMDGAVWRDTIIRNIIRLRNHPSLVTWCGGNEFDPDCAENKGIVDKLQSLCAEFDPSRQFHRASPYGGDSHSYQVNWMEGANYTFFTRDESVAITEFSMASPPAMESLKKFIPEDELQCWPLQAPDNLETFNVSGWSKELRRKESSFSLHDAHLSVALKVMYPFISDCGVPENWSQFVDYAQTAQGILTQFGIDFWRSRWPYCTMSMSWVFNVCWTSSMTWEYVDWFGVPKISYYYQKRAYEPLHVSAIFEELFWPPASNFQSRLFVCNDTLKSYQNCSVRVRLYDGQLNLLTENLRQVEVLADSVNRCGTLSYKIPQASDNQVLFLCVDFINDNSDVLSRSLYTPRIGESSIKMPYLEKGPWISDVKEYPTTLEAVRQGQWTKFDDGEYACKIAIQNTGDRPAYQASLAVPNHEEFMRYSDNFFWLEAGETRVVDVCTSLKELPDIEASAWNAPKTDIVFCNNIK